MDEAVAAVLRPVAERVRHVLREAAGEDPPVQLPPAVGRLVRMTRLPPAAAVQLLRAVDGDPDLLAVLRERVDPDADPPVAAWVHRPPGWELDLAETVAAEAARRAHEAARRRLVDHERDLERMRAEADRLRREADEARRRAREATNRADSRSAADRRERNRLAREIERLTAELEEVRARAAEELAERDRRIDRLEEELGRQRRRVRSREAELARVAAERDDDVERRRAEAEARRQAGEALGRALADLSRLRESVLSMAGALGVEPVTPAAGEGHRPGGDPGGDEAPGRRLAVPAPPGVAEDSPEMLAHLLARRALVIVDGYNVAFSGLGPDAPRDPAAARVWLERTLGELAARHRVSVRLVLDGAEGHPPPVATGARDVVVEYSPPGVTADDVIVDRVRSSPPGAEVVVVTSDRELAGRVRALGANVIPSSVLRAELTP